MHIDNALRNKICRDIISYTIRLSDFVAGIFQAFYYKAEFGVNDQLCRGERGVDAGRGRLRRPH
jgi:hypothetical protein